jgi:hypothetical protein
MKVLSSQRAAERDVSSPPLVISTPIIVATALCAICLGVRIQESDELAIPPVQIE